MNRAHELQYTAPLLVDRLNELIENLGMELPFALETPFDLTPGLLLGILESILQERLPILPSVRTSRDFTNKVQAMKIFLGVFETDILGGQDVGLSDIDPRRLADGGEDEVEFIGELLCWLGRKKGILAGPSHPDEPPPALPLRTHTRPASPSTHSTVTSGAHSNLSMLPTLLAGSDTTITSLASEPLAPLADPELPPLPAFPRASPVLRRSSSSHRPPPRCIHELEAPSFALDGADADAHVSHETSVCHCSHADEEEDGGLPPTPKPPLPIRHGGWIGVADEGSELQAYFRRRSPASAPPSSSRRAFSYPGLSLSASLPPGQTRSAEHRSQRIITPHNAPTAYTLALLDERARLLEELARIKSSPAPYQHGGVEP